MKGLKNIQTFEQHSSDISKHSIGERLKIKENIDNILKTHPLYTSNDNIGIENYLGKECVIENVVYDNKHNYYRYLIDIDNGDYWWVDECFN